MCLKKGILVSMFNSLFVFRIIALITLTIGFFFDTILGALLMLSFLIFGNTWAYVFNYKYYGKKIDIKLKVRLVLSILYIVLSIFMVLEFSLSIIHWTYLILILLDVIFLNVKVEYEYRMISEDDLKVEIDKLEQEGNNPAFSLLDVFRFKELKSTAYVILGYNLVALVLSDIVIFILSILINNNRINYLYILLPVGLFLLIQSILMEKFFHFGIGLNVSKLMRVLVYIKTVLILVYTFYSGTYTEEIKIISMLLLMICYLSCFYFFIFSSKEITNSKEL